MTRITLCVLLVAATASPAAAQERKWEIEVFGGAVVGTAGADGTRTLPPAGLPIVTSTPIFPSREVSSWVFGDGAVLLNDVTEQFGAAGRVTPLDPLLVATPAGRGGVFGARLRRRVTDRFSAEFSFDVLSSSSAHPDGFAAGVEATRQSFTSAFTSLLATGPFTGVAIDATASTAEGSRRDMTATGAVNIDLPRLWSLAPYATAGGGIAFGTGSMASAELTGQYRFAIAAEAPISETDTTSIRFERPAGFVVVLGGGVRQDLSEKWGLTIDARVHIGPDRTRVVVAAAPASVQGTPAGSVESFTNPAIQFSNDPSIGRRSTLSGPALDGFEVFEGGTRARTLITVALARRF
jgi:hypothetical protein